MVFEEENKKHFFMGAPTDFMWWWINGCLCECPSLAFLALFSVPVYRRYSGNTVAWKLTCPVVIPSMHINSKASNTITNKCSLLCRAQNSTKQLPVFLLEVNSAPLPPYCQNTSESAAWWLWQSIGYRGSMRMVFR